MTHRILLASAIILILAGVASIGENGGNAVASNVPADTLRRGSLTVEDSLKVLEKLASNIRTLINLPAEMKGGNVGIHIRSLSTGKTLFALNETKPLTPASTTKLVTTFTALSELGADYVVKTIVAADTKPRSGVIKGDIYVKGYGDPYLTVNEIDELVEQLINAGVKQIDGNVIGDGSFFDDKTERTQYSGDDDVVQELPPIAALTIENGVFTVVISSPSTPGVPCNVQTYPHSAAFEIVNETVTMAAPVRSRKGTRRRSSLDRISPEFRPGFDGEIQHYGDSYPLDAPVNQQRQPKKGSTTSTKKGAKPLQKGGRVATTPANKLQKGKAAQVQNIPKKRQPARQLAQGDQKPGTSVSNVAGKGGIRVSLSVGENGKQIITVTGSMATGRTISHRYAMKSPPMVIAGMLVERLQSHGVKIGGTPMAGTTPAKHKILAETGRPLVDILQYVMKNSNNFLAEYVFKMIGGAAGGQVETAEKSVEKIEYRMSLNKIDFSRCIINDGSGLSRANCLSASALSGILAAGYGDKKVFPALYSSMSIAGVDGTLRKRMRGTFAEGNVHGKTGTLRNVAALTGYVTTRDGEVLCFGMLMNGNNLGAYRTVQDKIAVHLASFSYADELARLQHAIATEVKTLEVRKKK